MAPGTRTGLPPAEQQHRRRRVRHLVAALSAACAAVYLAIAAGLVYPTPADSTGLVAFGLFAAAVYAVGAGAAVATDRLGPQAIGIGVQALALVAYVAVAGQRTPPFEPVGLVLKAVQVAIAVALLWLALAPGGRCACAWCNHHRDLHKGRCLVPACGCDVFL